MKPSVKMVMLVGALFFVGVTTGCSLLPRKPALTWHLLLQIDAPITERQSLVNKALVVIQSRLDAVGVQNFEVKAQGSPEDGRLLVRLPTMPNPDRLKELITAAGKLELVHIISLPSPNPLQSYKTQEEAIASITTKGVIPRQFRVLPFNDPADTTAESTQKWLVVGATPIVTGADLRNASSFRGASADRYEIMFSLNKAGAEKFGTWTASNINEYLGVVLNDEVKSAAFIKSQISDSGQITGHFTREMAEDLALVLKSGALPAHLTIVEDQIEK
jgi:preprotein translocase subunit SecD